MLTDWDPPVPALSAVLLLLEVDWTICQMVKPLSWLTHMRPSLNRVRL